MFRYVALIHDAADATVEGLAQRLGARLRGSAGWQCTHPGPGLQVFVAGAAARINEAYALADRPGLVLGKLFRRDGHAPVATFDGHDAAHIVDSRGCSLISDFWGRYVAFLPGAPGITRVVRDPSGTLPCYLMRHHGLWIVFSWLEDLLSTLPELPAPAVHWPGVRAHLLHGDIGGSATCLHGITRLLPGQATDLSAHGERRELLWNAVAIARVPAFLDTAEAARQLRDTVRACVMAWASCHDTLLLRLSGGLDSAIVLSALAARDRALPVVCLNYHSPDSTADERHYARLAATQARRELVEYRFDPDVDLGRLLESARTPAPVPYMGCMGTSRTDAATAARHGARALFTGGGGDQLFFEFRRWWPAADHLQLHGLDAGFLRAVLSAARLADLSAWRVLRLVVVERLRPARSRREPGRLFTLVRPEALLPALATAAHVHPALWEPTGLPIGKLNQTEQLIHPLGYYDTFERDAAPELVNPLLSQPLVELGLRLPTPVLTQGGRGRALARQAFAPDLPPQIAARRAKGNMNDYVKDVLLRHLPLARALLLDGHLMREGYLDRSKVDAVLSDRPTAITSHVSEVHLLIGIEAWLQRWLPAPTR